MDYSRHEALQEIGREGQQRITRSSAAIVGAGAVGCLTAMLLSRAGLRKLTVIDRDSVEESNLQRQMLYGKEDIGRAKADAAGESLRKMNPETIIETHAADIDCKNAGLLKADIILDCTDNMETRLLINDYCRKNRTTMVYSAAIRTTATAMAVLPEEPCLRCIFSESNEADTCYAAGILNTAAAAAAAMQATEAIKALTGKNTGEMLRLNLAKGELMKLIPKKRNGCEACNGNYEYLTGKKGSKAVKLCGTNAYQIKGRKAKLQELKKNLKGNFHGTGSCISTDGITLFKDGRAIIRARSEQEARAKYSKLLG